MFEPISRETHGFPEEFSMPIYEYQCQDCQHRFELRQGYDADTVMNCQVCDGQAKRRISLVPVIFKGSGWYVTDYNRSNSTIKESSSSDRASGSEETKENASEEKSGGKNESKKESGPSEETKSLDKPSTQEAKMGPGSPGT